ncbi:MAG: transposase [Phyllobacteriaceae bacterium]|nr:transposase [Phyllobacteriaceae bacterium]
MAEWFTSQEIADFCSLDLRSVNRLAAASHWRSDDEHARKRDGKGGGWEYHISLLPPEMQGRLMLANATQEEAAAIERTAAWEAFERMPERHREEAARRLAILETVQRHQNAGMSATQAVKKAAREAGVTYVSIYAWRKAVKGAARPDWLPMLAPNWNASGNHADVHAEAWTLLKSDYLRVECPTFSSCYRRMMDTAKAKGWTPVPSERALRRRLDAEVPASVQTAAREGKEATKQLYPAQRRTVAHLHAMQYANIDGHKFDVAVERNGRVFRPTMVALQDIYSRKIIAWRLDETENRDATRLAIGDMVANHGIPERLYSDNGRAFTSKWISGRAPTRFRFKVRDDDPEGLLTALGIQVHWTTPYSGQSKPIERAFRDLADTIARHPACSGAYMGNHIDSKPENYGSRAVPFNTFHALIEEEIARHNARPGRNTETAQGRSFDETFEASLAAPSTIVTRATPQQAALWLMAAERIRADRQKGSVNLFGTPYWNDALTEHAGKLLTVRFDPDDLHKPVRVYDAENRLICIAEPEERARFDDTQAARVHSRKRREFMKAKQEQARLHQELSADELASIMAETGKPERPKPSRPAVTRIATGSAVPKPQEEAVVWDDEDDAALRRAAIRLNPFHLIEGGRSDD